MIHARSIFFSCGKEISILCTSTFLRHISYYYSYKLKEDIVHYYNITTQEALTFTIYKWTFTYKDIYIYLYFKKSLILLVYHLPELYLR